MPTSNPQLVDGRYAFRDLVDIARLRQIFELFSEASGFTTGLVSYPDQELLIGTGWRDVCVKFHRAVPSSEIHCKHSNLDLTSRLQERRALNVRECESGLVDGATPIIIKGAHVANLFTGQILLEPPDLDRFRAQAEEHDYDAEAYLAAVAEVPVVSRVAFVSVLSFLSELAVLIGEQGLAELRVRAAADAARRNEEQLRELRNYLANIIDSMPSVLIGVDPAGRVTQWNSEASSATGLSAEHAVGRPLEECYPELVDELGQVRAAMRAREVLSEGRHTRDARGEDRHEHLTIYPLIANGVQGAVIRVDDVTERVRMQELLVQSEKMLSVGGLAAGMAHEINNPLAGMIQTADLLRKRLTDPTLPANQRAAHAAGTTMETIQAFMSARSIPRMLNTVCDTGARAADIVTSMLSFARKSEPATSSHRLEELIDQSLSMARSEYDLRRKYDFRAIEVVTDYAEGLPPVPCIPGKIQQVVLNLLRNASQALHAARQAPGGDELPPPRITIRLRAEPEAGWLRLEIEDNGPGIPDVLHHRIFEPFFTTKAAGVGTGLGLSVSYFIVEDQHGGELSVASSPGAGATFIVRLPLGRERVPR